jgi:hypothetical protein
MMLVGTCGTSLPGFTFTCMHWEYRDGATQSAQGMGRARTGGALVGTRAAEVAVCQMEELRRILQACDPEMLAGHAEGLIRPLKY